MIPILTLLLPVISSVLGKIIPDPGKAAEVNAELQKALIERQGEIDKAIAEAARAQAEVNLEEAKSSSMFVAGWRPFVGWVCGIGCAYSFIAQPMLTWVSGWFGGVPLPALDMTQLMPLILGMLGLGGLRTMEKIQGVDRQAVQDKKLK